MQKKETSTEFKGPVFEVGVKTVIIRNMRTTNVSVPYNVTQEAQWRYNRHMNGYRPTNETTTNW